MGKVRHVASPHSVLVMTSDYDRTAQRLFAQWTDPTLLTRWWPQEAEIEAHAGGSYHLVWPRQDWHLMGHFVAFEPDVCVAFTWRWLHEPEQPMRYVVVTFTAVNEDGVGRSRTRLTITHSLYGDEQSEQDQRQSHFEGWMHFLSRLHDC